METFIKDGLNRIKINFKKMMEDTVIIVKYYIKASQNY